MELGTLQYRLEADVVPDRVGDYELAPLGHELVDRLEELADGEAVRVKEVRAEDVVERAVVVLEDLGGVVPPDELPDLNRVVVQGGTVVADVPPEVH